MEPIISVLNTKAGVGCSLLTWNIAHTLGLDIHQHDNGLHHYFLKQRKQYLKDETVLSGNIDVYSIDKRKYSTGIYDLGSDINYAYVRNILKKSCAVVIPTDNGYEAILKTIATIQYVKENTDAMIFIVFNRLDSSDTDRERKYTLQAEAMISEHIGLTENEQYQFLYVRHSFSLMRYQKYGYFFLDNYMHEEAKRDGYRATIPFLALQNLRYHTVNLMLNGKKKEKAEKDIEATDFFTRHKPYFEEYQQDMGFTSKDSFSKLYDLKFNAKNRKTIKDMLILTTKIKSEYTRIWDN